MKKIEPSGDWHPVSRQPEEEGLYFITGPGLGTGKRYSYWDGKNWLWTSTNQQEAMQNEHPSVLMDDPRTKWCGVTGVVVKEEAEPSKDWNFSSRTEPEEEGLYFVKLKNSLAAMYSYWDGERWLWAYMEKDLAMKDKRPSVAMGRPASKWCGAK